MCDNTSRENCEKLVNLLKFYGFEDYMVYGNCQQLNAYLPNGEVFTYMCRSEKILQHTKNENGIIVMKWCGDVGIRAFLEKLGIDYDDGSQRFEQVNIIDYIAQGDNQ